MGKTHPRIHDLIGLLNTLFPPELAEDWDNVGLQVGDPDTLLVKGLVALDPGMDALNAARDLQAQVLITHHPLLFKSLKRLTPEDETGRILWGAVRDGIAVISAHTNLDCAQPGLNSWLAERLGLLAAEPLARVAGHLLKLVVYVPADHADQVADALFAAGAGNVGKYDQCSFRMPGTGTFRPGEGSSPFIGSIGDRQQVQEVRLEVVLQQSRLGKVLERLFKAHPYEEVAYDLIPLANQQPGVGLGRIGHLPEKMPLSRFVDQVREALGCKSLRIVGGQEDSIGKAAVCGGSGASLIQAAHRCGADVIVTGDVKYHEARLAETLGLAVIDAGHFATEQLMVTELTGLLNHAAGTRGWDVVFEAFAGEEDPFRIF
jgi:dinuclear metal center YbgI/SA1388 family protein